MSNNSQPSTFRWIQGDKETAYTRVRTIGTGGYGKAVLLRHRDGKLRVCKIIVPPTPTRVEDLDEVDFLENCVPRNRRVTRLYETIQSTPAQCQLYFEYCSGGDLCDITETYEKIHAIVPEPFIWHVFLQLSEALAFMHEGYDHKLDIRLHQPQTDNYDYIHGDLKPENVFLRRSRKGQYPDVVLGDFGCVRSVPHTDIRGTLEYSPPEFPYSSPAGDVWALGATIQALANGCSPMPNPPAGVSVLDWARRGAQSRVRYPLMSYSRELEECVRMAMDYTMNTRQSSMDMVRRVMGELERGVACEEIWEPLDRFR